jgi:hypothetical protein
MYSTVKTLGPRITTTATSTRRIKVKVEEIRLSQIDPRTHQALESRQKLFRTGGIKSKLCSVMSMILKEAPRLLMSH